jgi:hypothetical protein
MVAVLLLAVAATLVYEVSALNAYGHAFSRPNDFTDTQITALATSFKIFTVEKDTVTSRPLIILCAGEVFGYITHTHEQEHHLFIRCAPQTRACC